MMTPLWLMMMAFFVLWWCDVCSHFDWIGGTRTPASKARFWFGIEDGCGSSYNKLDNKTINCSNSILPIKIATTKDYQQNPQWPGVPSFVPWEMASPLAFPLLRHHSMGEEEGNTWSEQSIPQITPATDPCLPRPKYRNKAMISVQKNGSTCSSMWVSLPSSCEGWGLLPAFSESKKQNANSFELMWMRLTPN